MTFEAVCFDLDDTLFDYHEYARRGLRAAAERVAERTGRRLHAELFELYFDEGVTEGTFDRLVERHDLPEDLVADLVEAFHDSTGPLSPYPTAEPVLSSLAQNHALGLVTDGRGGHDKLRRLGLTAYFDVVVVTPTLDSSKHDPTVFDRVLSELAVSATATAYVGDDPRVDFRVPNRLGMTTIRLRRGRYAALEADAPDAEPTHEIAHLSDLPALVEAGPGVGEQSA